MPARIARIMAYQPFTQRQPEQAKAAELTAAGHPVTASAVAKRRRRYQEQGLAGMVDNRARRRMPPHGRAGEAVVAAMRKAIGEAAEDSTKTAAFVFRRTREILAEEDGDGSAALRRRVPSTACSPAWKPAVTLPGRQEPAGRWVPAPLRRVVSQVILLRPDRLRGPGCPLGQMVAGATR